MFFEGLSREHCPCENRREPYSPRFWLVLSSADQVQQSLPTFATAASSNPLGSIGRRNTSAARQGGDLRVDAVAKAFPDFVVRRQHLGWVVASQARPHTRRTAARDLGSKVERGRGEDARRVAVLGCGRPPK